MSIVPVGKNRHQVNQGGFKHESMLSDDIFASLMGKIALAPGTVLDEPQEEVPNVPDDLQSAMNDGGLNPERGMPEGADMGGGNAGEPMRGSKVTDQGQQVTMTVQKALGLDPADGWTGSTTFDNAADGTLTGITIKLRAQPGGKLVQKV